VEFSAEKVSFVVRAGKRVSVFGQIFEVKNVNKVVIEFLVTTVIDFCTGFLLRRDNREKKYQLSNDNLSVVCSGKMPCV